MLETVWLWSRQISTVGQRHPFVRLWKRAVFLCKKKKIPTRSFSGMTRRNCGAFPYFYILFNISKRTAGDPHYFLAEWIFLRIHNQTHTCANKTDDTAVSEGLVIKKEKQLHTITTTHRLQSEKYIKYSILFKCRAPRRSSCYNSFVRKVVTCCQKIRKLLQSKQGLFRYTLNKFRCIDIKAKNDLTTLGQDWQKLWH